MNATKAHKVIHQRLQRDKACGYILEKLHPAEHRELLTAAQVSVQCAQARYDLEARRWSNAVDHDMSAPVSPFLQHLANNLEHTVETADRVTRMLSSRR
jgi:hypothetical protein